MKLNLVLLAASISISLLISNVQAHFLWLVPTDESGAKVSLYFSEGPEPDNPALLKRITSARVVPFRTDKPDGEIGFAFEDGDTRLVARHAGASAWNMTHTYGTHGREERNLLIYSAAAVSCRRPGMGDKDVVSLPKVGYTATPSIDGETLTVQIWDNEKIAADIAVELQSPNDHQSLRTDSEGRIIVKNVDPGVYAIRCLETEETPGEYEGVAYKAVKKYTTVSFIVPNLNKVSAADSKELGLLPEAITSFGATVIGDNLFAYGGHTGSAHSYSSEEQFNKLIRLDLKSSKAWETIAEGRRIQGNALVADEASVILVGGFSAQNTKDEKSRLVSQSSVQKFDLKQGKWIELPNLPEPRSSMDAVVLDGFLYVVGGWSMTGDSSETKWLKTAWRLPLGDNQNAWQPIAEPPFQRRALAVASHTGRLFVIGGMNAVGGPTTETCAYDPSTNTWEVLGSIVGVPMNGFGAAATELNGTLIVSTVDGSIQELNDTYRTWSVIGQAATGRFFHRILPVSKDSIGVFGGANMEVGKFRETAVFTKRSN
jgi:hypothetical protein